MHKILLPFLFVALPVMAQPIYSYTDSNGNKVYTNERPPANVNVEEVNLPKTPTAPREQSSTPSKSRNTQTAVPNITSAILQGIPNDETLRANNGNFTVTIAIKNASSTSLPYQYRLLLDGQPYGSIQGGNSFALTNIDRGQHTIQGQVIYKGSIIAATDAHTFNIQRVAKKRPKIQPKAKS